MRLLSTASDTLEIHNFLNVDALPPYAILSHCWGQEKDEVSLLQLHSPGADALPGYRKIMQLLKLARSHGLAWAWIDTCCIDKTSSAELSEAINSMYAWYRKAQVCYVFLHDLDTQACATSTSDSANQSVAISDALAHTTWFERGWTLQELLAPTQVVFFDRTLRALGQRDTLASQLARYTGIDSSFLQGRDIHEACVAEKMSWLAHRKTTRPEDLAYCMLGIFDVNLPLLYGEGTAKAFQRLQEAIIMRTSDQSIFAWRYTGTSQEPSDPVIAEKHGISQEIHGLLATHPRHFARSGGVRRLDDPDRRSGYQLVNQGIEVEVASALPLSLLVWMPVRFLRGRTSAASAKIRDLVLELTCEDVSGEGSGELSDVQSRRTASEVRATSASGYDRASRRISLHLHALGDPIGRIPTHWSRAQPHAYTTSKYGTMRDAVCVRMGTLGERRGRRIIVHQRPLSLGRSAGLNMGDAREAKHRWRREAFWSFAASALIFGMWLADWRIGGFLVPSFCAFMFFLVPLKLEFASATLIFVALYAVGDWWMGIRP